MNFNAFHRYRSVSTSLKSVLLSTSSVFFKAILAVLHHSESKVLFKEMIKPGLRNIVFYRLSFNEKPAESSRKLQDDNGDATLQ